MKNEIKQGMCHTVALRQKKRITETQKYLKAKEELWKLKKYLKAKEELWKLKYNLQNKSSKTNQNPSRSYYNSIITKLKFQHKPKYQITNNPQIKIDLLLLLLPRGL